MKPLPLVLGALLAWASPACGDDFGYRGFDEVSRSGSSVPKAGKARKVSVSAPRTYVADASLLLSCSAADALPKKYSDPYVTVFSDDQKSLIYVASAHESGPGGETFKTIDKVLKLGTPQALVLEGLNFDQSTPEDYLDGHVKDCRKNGFEGCDEAAYAASKLRKHHIPIVTGDPSDARIFIELQDEKYKYVPLDIAGFYLARTFPQWHRELGAGYNATVAEAKAREFLRNPNHPWKATPVTYEDFLTWYGQHNSGVAQEPWQLKQDDFKPGSATYFQKFNDALCGIREPNILKTVQDQLSQHDEVLIIYGGLHLAAERAVWQKMLPGKPVDLKY